MATVIRVLYDNPVTGYPTPYGRDDVPVGLRRFHESADRGNRELREEHAASLEGVQAIKSLSKSTISAPSPRTSMVSLVTGLI